MLIDRSHMSWALFSGISLIAGTVSYVAYAWGNPKGPSGGSAMGLLYGVVGTLMLLFAGLLAARKPLRIRRLGSAQFWLKGHLWLGTLCIPFILFHSGFGWGGFLEQLMWYSLMIVAVSGVFGLAMQQFLPRLLWYRTPLETFEAQTPYQCDRMTVIADLRIAGLCESPLEVPSEHLREHFARLVSGYYSIVNGHGARNEQNARKLLLLQEVSPPEVRDFFWAMAKYAKSEAKAIRLEGDFPELLATTYAGLKGTTLETATQTAAPKSLQHEPAESPDRTKPIATRSSDTSKPPAVAAAVRKTSPPDSGETHTAATSAAETLRLSPLEMMKQKAAEKAKGTAETPAASPAIPNPAINAAETAAASPETDVKPVSPAKRSPLDLLKKKSPEATNPESQSAETAKTLSPKLSTVKDTAEGQPATATANRTAASPEKPVQPTVLEKQLLRSVYLNHVRPFLAENRSRRTVRTSPLLSAVEAQRLFHQHEATLPATLHPVLDELGEFCEIRRQIELQRQILRWMHWWLMIHVPAAIVLLIFLVAHVVMALRIIPFNS